MRGDWTLDEITYAIKNNLEAGLHTTGNYSFSIKQLENQVIAERNALIQQLKANKVFDINEAIQEINCIEIDCENLSMCCDLDTKNPTLHFVIPTYLELAYVGLVDHVTSFKIYNSSANKYNKYRNSMLVNRPYVRLRIHEGVTHGFIFNPPTPHLKYISVSGVWENPLSVNQYSCCSFNPQETRFPIPQYLVQQIVDGITNRWSSYYYRFQGQRPNTQTAIV